MRNFLRRVMLVMLLGIALYGAAVVYTGYHKISDSLTAFHWSAFALAVALATANYGLRFLKWEYYLARLGIRNVGKLDSLLIFLSGFVLTVTPGKVGEVFKSAVLAETHAVPVARTAPIVIADRLTDVIGVVVLILFGSAGFSGGLPWAAGGAAAVLVGLLFIIWEPPVRALIRAMERAPERLSKLAPRLTEAYDSLRVLASPVALLWPSALAIVSWGCEGVSLYVLLRGFGAPPPFALTIFFYATATLAGAIIPVPGGLGVTEAMIQQQLVRLGHIAQGAATSAMILVRFATLWWAVIVGFAALAILRVRYPRLLKSGEVAPAVVIETNKT